MSLKLKILPYEKIAACFKPWSEVYLDVAKTLINTIQTDELNVIHIGSTSAQVGGKGIIDLSVLYSAGSIDLAVARLSLLGFQDQISDKPFPAKRPRKDGGIIFDDRKYFVHVHVIEKDCDEHVKQVQYREYMLADSKARQAYEQSKKQILAEGIIEQEAYGKRKSVFVKDVLQTIE